jgi:hypothetical protein
VLHVVVRDLGVLGFAGPLAERRRLVRDGVIGGVGDAGARADRVVVAVDDRARDARLADEAQDVGRAVRRRLVRLDE